MSKSNIEWLARPGTLPETWNLVTGCNKVSQGCKNCYAEIMHRRLQGMFPSKYNHDFLTGAHMHPDLLTLPLKWKKPRTVFVNSMSDLFHEKVTFDFIDQVYAMMMGCPQHTFIILTKRPQRMLKWYNWKNTVWINEGMQGPERIRYQAYHSFGFNIDYNEGKYWPLPNVWLCVTAENQEAADERIPLLLQVPAAVRGISCEPLLGPVEIRLPIYIRPQGFWWHFIDWVIAGGESGHHARPMHPDWARSLRDQCQAASIPFFFKQWGEYAPHMLSKAKGLKSIVHNGFGQDMCKVGKKAAGHLLDGKEWNQWPVTEHVADGAYAD